MLEDQASCRTVSENASVYISQLSLSSPDTAPTSNDFAFSHHAARLRRDRSDKRNLELERCLRKPLVQHGADGEAHTAVEQGCCNAAMNGAGRVELPCMG